MKNQSPASLHQHCQTQNPSAPLARDGALSMDPFYSVLMLCYKL